jgi:hypothetical protein
MDTAIRPAKDLAGLLNYAPPRVREQPQAPLVKDKPPMERPLRSLGVETAAPMGREDFAVNLRRRVSLDPELVPEPKSLKEEWSGAIALRGGRDRVGFDLIVQSVPIRQDHFAT